MASWAAFGTGTRCSIPWGLGGGDLCLFLLTMCRGLYFPDLFVHQWCWLDSFGKALVHVNEDFHHLGHTVLHFKVASVFNESLGVKITAEAAIGLLCTGIVHIHTLKFSQ